MGNVCRSRSRSSAVEFSDKFDKDLNEVSLEEDDDTPQDLGPQDQTPPDEGIEKLREAQ